VGAGTPCGEYRALDGIAPRVSSSMESIPL
jgi:hypothetical protein